MEELIACTVVDPRVENGDCVNVAAELRVGCCKGVSELAVVELTDTVEKDVEIAAESNSEDGSDSDSADCVALGLVEVLVCVVCSGVSTIVVVVSFALRELCSSLVPSDPSLEPITLEQSAPIPALMKNMPIRVSGVALSPLH